MDNNQLQFLVKCMLGICVAVQVITATMGSPILSQNQNENSPAESSFQPAFAPNPQYIADNNRNTQNVRRQAFSAVAPQGNSGNSNTDAYKTYHPSYIANYQQLTPGGMELVNIRPSRRTIMSTLLAPLISMREQAMTMLSATMQGCSNGTGTSLLCRLLRMFNVV